VPNLVCTNCGLRSYAPTPHSVAPSLCPYCDAELFPRITRPAPAGEDAATAGDLEAEAA
jgi:hypothetical protein